MNLQQLLHDQFLSCDQILSGYYLAQIIADHEMYLSTKFDDKTVFEAIYYASDQFVDSMINNAMDTWQGQGCKGKPDSMFESEEDYDAYCARYEAIRPKNARIAELLAKLS